MSTGDILQTAVITAQDALKPQLSDLEGYLQKLRGLKEEQLSKSEKNILKIDEALKNGLPLINAITAISAGGLNDQGLPRIALAPYSLSLCRGRINTFVQPNGSMNFRDINWGSFSLWLPAGTLQPEKGFLKIFTPTRAGSTLVPLVPPELRLTPNMPGTIDDYYVMFEVQQWDEVLVQVDPYLLYHINGYVYAIAGSWDVTETELRALQAARNLGF